MRISPSILSIEQCRDKIQKILIEHPYELKSEIKKMLTQSFGERRCKLRYFSIKSINGGYIRYDLVFKYKNGTKEKISLVMHRGNQGIDWNYPMELNI